MSPTLKDLRVVTEKREAHGPTFALKEVTLADLAEVLKQEGAEEVDTGYLPLKTFGDSPGVYIKPGRFLVLPLDGTTPQMSVIPPEVLTREVRTVLWLDSSGMGGWNNIDEIESHGLSRCVSVGFVVKEDKEMVMLAGSVDLAHGNVSDAIAIPKVCIVSAHPERP